MISTDLLLKGLGGLAVVGGASGVGIWYFNRGKTEELSTFAARVGLVCNAANGQTEETGIECNIEEKGLSVKQGTNKEEGKKKSGTPAGKIKGYKVGDGFKFVIEEGDIALTGGATNSPVSKLEQFETYEIKEDEKDKKQYLTRKNDAKKEIKLALGLPEGDTNCDLPDTTEKACPLDADKIKKINFEGRKGEPTVVNGAAAGAGAGTTTINLKISKPSTDENSIFPHGYKFTLTSNRDINLGDSKSIKKDTNTEFKIKVTPAAGGPKLTLEKAWTVGEFAKKVGLECNEALTKEVGECTLKDGSVNVNNNVSGASETNKKFENHSKKTSEGDKKVKFELDKEGYNQGFKFFVDDASGIALQNGAGDSGSEDKKIEPKGSSGTTVTYQILKDTDNKWYLTKKITPAPAA